MIAMMRGVAVAAALTVLSSAAWAQADEFIAACTSTDKSDAQAKACACMSAKVTTDRPLYIATMRKLDATPGKEPDISKLSPEEVQVVTKIFELLASCFQ